MPYLTPETLPTENQCRRLLIPDSPEWLAIVSGALTELSLNWNWQQKGITVDEALEAAQAIIFSYYNQPCTDPESCVTEEGTRIIRLLPGGLYEELINGTWQTPEGDLEIEPTPARTEPTEADRLCLAAKNAANVMKQLYEEVTDAFDEFGAIAPVITAMLAGIAALVAAFVSAAAAAFVVLGASAVQDFFELLGIVSFDLWNEEFEELFYCILLEHATDDDGVVHFDYDAVTAALHDEINGVSLDIQRKQLCLQVLYLLNIMAGPGLDWSGTTTAISDDDCSNCTDDTWCHEWNFAIAADGWVNLAGSGSWSSGVGFISQVVSPNSILGIALDIAPDVTLTNIQIAYHTGANKGSGVRFFVDALNGIVETQTNLAAGTGDFYANIDVSDIIDRVAIVVHTANNTSQNRITAVRMSGTGTSPFTENCP